MFEMILIGNVVRNPEMQYTPNGKSLVRITVAADTGFGEYRKTAFVRATAFGRPAEVLHQYCQKGTQIFLRLRPDIENGGPRAWEGRDGDCRASYGGIVEDFQLLSRTRKRTEAEANESGADDGIPYQDDFDTSLDLPSEQEEIPF